MSKSKKNKAQAMVVVFIYVSVVSLMAIYMMGYAANLNQIIIREINYEKGFYAGEAALIQSFSQLCNGSGNVSEVGVGTMTFGPTKVIVEANPDGPPPPNGYIRIRATVTDWQKW